jgi:tol-pal system protein YbgF
MKLIRTAIMFCAVAPFLGAASKEIVELQRDVALLQDQLRTLQRSVDERFSSLQTLVQQALEASNRTNTSLAVMQSRFSDTVKEQQASIAGPVAGVGSKLDQMSEDFRAVRETVLDMNSRMSKLDAKLADLQNAVTVIRNPASAPPPATGAAGTTGGSDGISAPATAATASAPPPGMRAEDTYTNAFRDYSGGQYDIAMQEFSDYLKYFPNTQFAPNAQYYVGDIYFRRKDYDRSIEAFDAVLEHYSANSKTAPAHYKKGESLLALGKRDAAAREFRDVVSHYPDSDVAPKAKLQLRDLGLSSAPPPAKPRRRR